MSYVSSINGLNQMRLVNITALLTRACVRAHGRATQNLWSEIKYSAFVCLGLIWVNVHRAYCFCLGLYRRHVNITTARCQRSKLAKRWERAMKVLGCRRRAINILAGILCLLASCTNRQQACAPETITDSQTHYKKYIFTWESEQCRKVSSVCYVARDLCSIFLFWHSREA